MRVCQLVPGSGGTFYCQNCLRDLTLVRALRGQGHDVVMVPLYLPPFAEEAGLEHDVPVFFGGINVYLRERFPLFRKTPQWVDRLFDTSLMLKLAASREGSTNAAKLGPMTLSMLEGRSGHQEKGFNRLAEWLGEHDRPDVIHISNALLLGLATEIKRSFDVPIVCTLQDEEPWVEAMPAPYNRLCWEAMARHAALVDAFIVPSAWYADRMRTRLHPDPEKIFVVPLGVELDEGTRSGETSGGPKDGMAIGFLARLSESQGLGVLVDAFIALKQDPAFKALRLRATGGCTAADRPFIAAVRAKIHRHGLDDAVDFVPGFQKPQRRDFLRSLSVLSVPVPQGEAFGIQLIEAMALGVPVVQPNVGAYPEIIEPTGGGMLYDPARPDGLADALRAVLSDREAARVLGERGRAAVYEKFGIQHAAANILKVYETMLG